MYHLCNTLPIAWPAAPGEGIVWGGIPLGTDAYITSTVRAVIAEHLGLVEDASSPFWLLRKQQAFLALFHCVLPRPSDLIRMLPARLVEDAISGFDASMIATLVRLLELPPTALGDEWTAAEQIGLPIPLGGFGLRPKLRIMHEAYLAAYLGSHAVIQTKWPALAALVRDIGLHALGEHLPTAIDVRAAHAHVVAAEAEDKARGIELDPEGGVLEKALEHGLTDLAPAPGGFAGLQRRLSKAVDHRLHVRLLAPTVPRERRAFLRSCGGAGAGSYLTSLPGVNVACKMTSRQFAVACQFRLNLDLPDLVPTRAGRHGLCPAVPVAITTPLCDEACTTKGEHLPGCKRGKGAIDLHDKEAYVLARVGVAAVYPPEHVHWMKGDIKTRVRRLIGIEDSDATTVLPFPAPDVYVPCIDAPLIVDVTIGDARLPSYVAHAAEKDGATAAAKEAAKVSKYKLAFGVGPGKTNWRPTDFHAFALETGGRMGKGADGLCKQLARMYEEQVTGEAKEKLGPVGSRFLQCLRQALSATLAKGIADRVIGAHAGMFAIHPSARGRDALLPLTFGEMAVCCAPC